MAAAPAIVQFVGGTPADATENSRRMRADHRRHATRRSRCRRSNFGADGGRHRRPTGARHRRAADDQHRHRAPRGRRRPDRRRRHDGADGLLHRRDRRARAPALSAAEAHADERARRRRARRQRARARRAAPVDRRPVRRPCSRSPRTSSTWSTQAANLVVTHGNGPQVGFILRRSELALAEVAPVPHGLRRRRHAGRDRLHVPQGAGQRIAPPRSSTDRSWRVVTQTVVAADDPAFAHPVKPVGAFMDEAVARAARPSSAGRSPRMPGRGLAAHGGLAVPQGDRRTARRSPRCCRQGAIVVAAGGGGVPVVRGGRRQPRRRRGRGRQGPRLGAAGRAARTPTCSSSRPASTRWP